MTQQAPSDQDQRQAQQTVGTFPTQETAEAARRSLQENGFAADKISIDDSVFDPNPRIRDTQALPGARGGASIGALFGALVGLLLVTVSLGSATSDATPVVDHPWLSMVGITLAGSGVGTVAGGLLGAFSGLNAPKADTQTDRDRLSHSYLVVLEGTEAEILKAQDALRHWQSDEMNRESSFSQSQQRFRD